MLSKTLTNLEKCKVVADEINVQAEYAKYLMNSIIYIYTKTS